MGKNNKNSRLYTAVPIWIVSILAVLAMTILTAILTKTEISPVRAGILSVSGFVLSSVLFVTIYRFIFSRVHTVSAIDDNVSDLECNLTLNLLTDLYMPVVLVNDAGKIIWYNQSFASLAEDRGVLYGKNFSDYCAISPASLTQSESPKGPVITAFGAYYNIKAYNLPYDQQNMVLTVWNDCTKLEQAYRKIADEEPLVAFIVIDNLDELIQYAQEAYRSASVEVEGILRAWAESINGIFREYERDKFLLVFQSQYLAQFISSKFDILDKIRNVRVGEGNLPVTVSIGISQTSGNLTDKEKASRSALDMALQRGGDQVVLKSAQGMEFYGGKVQTAQKRTKVRARVVAEEITHLITQSDNVLIMSHVYPDYDAIGSSIGMLRLAAFCGTKAHIVTNLSSPELQKCKNKLGQAAGYADREVFVDFAQAQELLESGTLLIITDVNNRSQFESPELADNAHNIVVIDHHRKAAQFNYDPLVTYIEPAASSTCELVSEMLEHVLSPGTMTREEADILLAGIMLDTKQFTRNTGSRTFGAALYLRNEGANPASAGELFRTELSDVVSEAGFESNVIIYRSAIAIAQNTERDKSSPRSRIAAAKAADKLLKIEGIEASFVLCQSDETIHISARSAGKINVQLVLEKMGGGGHFDSAATQLKNTTLSQALTRLKKAVDEYLRENKE